MLDLSHASGIYLENDFDEAFNALKNWEIVQEKDYELKDNNLDYEFLSKTIAPLLDEENNVERFNEIKWFKNVKANDLVNKDEEERILELLVMNINNKTFETTFNYKETSKVKNEKDNLEIGDIIYIKEDNEYKKVESIKDNKYIFTQAEFEEIFEELELSSSFDVNFDEIELIPYGKKIVSESNYTNPRYTLLANKLNDSFDINGYKVNYSLNSNGVSINVTKTNNSNKFYANLSINKIKPSIKWYYDKGDIKNAYFKVDFNTNEKIGSSSEKYKKYYLDFKDLDSSSFLSLLKSSINKADTNVETEFPLCKLRIPIAEIPTANILLDVNLKVSADGKIELVLKNAHSFGFEIKDGKARMITDSNRDIDVIIQGNMKSGLGIGIALEMVNKKIMDIASVGGINASIKTILHLYDEEGQFESVYSDLPYSTIQDISKENKDVKICGDTSFNWYLDLLINSSSTFLYKHGLTKKISLLDEDNQIFKNKHHIENGHFVDKCTRESRPKTIDKQEEIKSDKLLLNRSSIILRDNTYQIEIKSLPDGYKLSDISYLSEDNNIANVNNGLISPISKGNTRILVKTNDDKYSVYLNVLVSK